MMRTKVGTNRHAQGRRGAGVLPEVAYSFIRGWLQRDLQLRGGLSTRARPPCPLSIDGADKSAELRLMTARMPSVEPCGPLDESTKSGCSTRETVKDDASGRIINDKHAPHPLMEPVPLPSRTQGSVLTWPGRDQIASAGAHGV